MDTISLWDAISTRKTTFPQLTEDLDVDVAIIGAGITGITAANQLLNSGKTVAILEANRVGSGTTGYSTGNLYVTVQPFYQEIAAAFDVETAKIIAHSRKLAIDYIEKNITERSIACQFSRRPWYGYTMNNERLRISIDKEVDLLKHLEIPIEFTDQLPLPVKFKKAVVMENQARFNPMQYVISMAEHIAEKGCMLFENTRVTAIKEKGRCILQTEHGKVTAHKVLIATHTPIGVHEVQFFTAPYRSYVVSVRLEDEIYPEGHFWDLDKPPHAICTHASSTNKPDLLMVAGSHHKTGQGEALAHYKELEKFLRNHFKVKEVAYRWSAQHYQTADKVPYIGLASRHHKSTYMATGYWADGLIYGTLAGALISNLMLDQENPLATIYRSTRRKLMGSSAFLMKESSNVLMQYMKDYPLWSSVSFDDIKAGEGKVVQIAREKIAVSRDENNVLHKVSAVCTHMKCIVNWNFAEKTWDCPCHGSRFTCEGKVIEGPAIKDLQRKPD